MYTMKLGRLFLDKNKLQGYLNIAKKAGYVIIGGEKLYNYNKKLYLVIYDNTSEKNTLKVVDKIKQRNISIYSIDNLQDIVSIKNCKIIGIKNKNLSDIMMQCISD